MPKTNTLARPATKSELIQKLLSRKSGTDVRALQSATGWQSHSVRAALSGLRRAGFIIVRADPATKGGASVYRINSAPETRQ